MSHYIKRERKSKMPGASIPLHKTISELTNLRVPGVEDNSLYSLTDNELGLLYAHATFKVTSSNSPGLLLVSHGTISKNAESEFQRRFQQYTRNEMFTRQGKIVLHKLERSSLTEHYEPLAQNFDKNTFDSYFSRNSIEHVVAELFYDNNNEAIGKALRVGAKSFFNTTLNPRHERLAFEYRAINQELRR